MGGRRVGRGGAEEAEIVAARVCGALNADPRQVPWPGATLSGLVGDLRNETRRLALVRADASLDSQPEAWSAHKVCAAQGLGAAPLEPMQESGHLMDDLRHRPVRREAQVRER